MRSAPLILTALLLAPLVPVASAETTLVVSFQFVNPDGFALDGTAYFDWQDNPVIAITVEDDQGAPVDATVRLISRVDDLNNAQIARAVDKDTDANGLAVMFVPEDLNLVGFLPGDHTLQIRVDTGNQVVVETTAFRILFP